MVLRTTLICMIVSLTGCAIPNNNFLYNPAPQLMSVEDLNQFRIECSHAAEQMAFLEKQAANLPYYEVQSERKALISNLMQSMEYCPPQPAKAVGCVHVSEDFNAGSAQATVCNSNPNVRTNPTEKPIVNRWDPLVDIK
jgi:hypothetical protein